MPMFPAAMVQPLLASERSGTSVRRSPPSSTMRDTTGEDIAELVDVDYDPLPVRGRPAAAPSKATRLLFPKFGTNVATSRRQPFSRRPSPSCEVVVTQEILNQRVAVAPMEVRSAAAAWDADGRSTTWIPNQGAQARRSASPRCSACTIEQVRVITPAVGGAFGAKFGADPNRPSSAGSPGTSAARRPGSRPVRRTWSR